MAINAYAALQAKQKLQPHTYDPAPLGPNEVEIEITHCGICHSDVHLIDNDWGISQYPLVPGHEIVGIVRSAGAGAHLKPGQRVGVGWQCGSCMNCEWCVRGEENCCPDNRATCVGRPGGFAKSIRVDGRFAFLIPDGMASENAAPLLCGGITVYSPMRLFGVQPHHKVGVIGIGGLGHLGIQFAAAMGCEVTAFSTSPDKEDEARAFGAHYFVVTKDAGHMKAAANTQDFILNTVFASLDWGLWLSILRTRGTMFVLGAPPGNLEIPGFQLLLGQKAVRGSAIGDRSTIREMLEFADRHGVEAKTEVMPMSKANEAIEKVRRNQARYRMVLKN
jgi:uncharacterized zinc-type alcohol dehydrogenase-like protein